MIQRTQHRDGTDCVCNACSCRAACIIVADALWQLDIKVLVMDVGCVTLGKCLNLSGLGEFIFKSTISGNFLNLTKDIIKGKSTSNIILNHKG